MPTLSAINLPDSVITDVVLLAIGLYALYLGAEWLVNSAAKISLKFGISPLAVGLTVVAFGTSAPELFVSLNFNAKGQPDMSLGNVVGSNICNIGLVLGISAFIASLAVKRSLLVRDMSVLVGASALFVFFLRDKQFSQVEGIIMFVLVLAYTIFRLSTSKSEAPSEEVGSKEDAMKASVFALAGMVLAGLVVLYIGSVALETGGVSLAERFNVPGGIIALTVIAFSTSVPELATSIVACIKKEGDFITGNIIGSCLFNLLCVIGVTAMVKPVVVENIEYLDLFVMLAFTLVLVPIMGSRSLISRWEGTTLLIGYVCYCVYLWYARIGVAVA